MIVAYLEANWTLDTSLSIVDVAAMVREDGQDRVERVLVCTQEVATGEEACLSLHVKIEY